MALLRFATIAAAFTAKHPTPAPGTLASVSAAGAEPEEGTIPSIEAMAVRGFTQPAGKLQIVKATEHFYVAGELVKAGEYVEIPEADANMLINANRAERATQADAAKADADAAAAAADEAADKAKK